MRTPLIPVLVLLAGFAAPAAAGAAETRYVKIGGLSSGECLTSATACTYARALNAGGPTDNGDTVEVAPGTYNVSPAEVNLTKSITVVGNAAGQRPVFIGTDNSATTFRVAAGASGSTIAYLDIRASGSSSPAFIADVSVTARRLALRSNSTCGLLSAPGSTLEDSEIVGDAPGLICLGAMQANTTLHNLDIATSQPSSGALWFGGAGSQADELSIESAGVGATISGPGSGERARLHRSVIRAAAGYALSSGGRALVTDTVLRSFATNGRGLFVVAGDSQVRNVTAIASGAGSEAFYVDSGPPSAPPNLLVRNTIAQGAGAGIEMGPGKPDPVCMLMPATCSSPDYVPGTAGRSHSNVGTVIGNVADLGGNREGDPLFRNAAGGDYRLSTGSNAIDAGTDDPENGITDLGGGPRKLGAAVDMGAHEFDSGPGPGTGDMPGGEPTGEMPTGGTGAAGDATMPMLTGLRLTARRFRVGPSATPLVAGTPRGTRFRYMLSEPAVVTFAIARQVAGRRSGRRCVRPTRRLRRAKPCKRYVSTGSFRRMSAAGSLSVPFSGRIGRKALAPGAYRLRVTATDAAGNKSLPVEARFTVVRR